MEHFEHASTVDLLSTLPGRPTTQVLMEDHGATTMLAQETDLLKQVRSHPPVRTLKIEEDGDFWKGLIKPKIRLTGRWLEQAGFRPGNRVRVVCVAPGVIELRSPDAMTVIETKQPSSKRPEAPF